MAENQYFFGNCGYNIFISPFPVEFKLHLLRFFTGFSGAWAFLAPFGPRSLVTACFGMVHTFLSDPDSILLTPGGLGCPAGT